MMDKTINIFDAIKRAAEARHFKFGHLAMPFTVEYLLNCEIIFKEASKEETIYFDCNPREPEKSFLFEYPHKDGTENVSTTKAYMEMFEIFADKKINSIDEAILVAIKSYTYQQRGWMNYPTRTEEEKNKKDRAILCLDEILLAVESLLEKAKRGEKVTDREKNLFSELYYSYELF